MNRIVRKADLLLLLALALFSLAALAISVRQGSAAEDAVVRVLLDGRTLGVYPLDTEAKLLVTTAEGGQIAEAAEGVSYADGNLVIIEAGSCRVAEADCPDGICVKRGRISRNGETIVCLPHRLVVEIAGGAEAEVDTIAR